MSEESVLESGIVLRIKNLEYETDCLELEGKKLQKLLDHIESKKNADANFDVSHDDHMEKIKSLKEKNYYLALANDDLREQLGWDRLMIGAKGKPYGR